MKFTFNSVFTVSGFVGGHRGNDARIREEPSRAATFPAAHRHPIEYKRVANA